MNQTAPIDEQLQIYTREIKLQPGLILNYTAARYTSTEISKASYIHDSDYIHLNCLLGGKFEATVRNQFITLGAGDINAGFAHGEKFQINHCANLSNIELMISSELLRDIAGQNCDLLKDRDDGFFSHTRHASNRVRSAAIQLSHQLNKEDYPQLLLHSAALDYLYWHLHALAPSHNKLQVCTRERKQLMEARDFLLADLSAPPTIADIARKVGLNQFKLKQGFRQLFDNSIYSYFQGERMKKAQLMLEEYNVTETAMMLGYSNVSHFSTAFRKQFGTLPSKARQEHIIG